MKSKANYLTCGEFRYGMSISTSRKKYYRIISPIIRYEYYINSHTKDQLVCEKSF